MDPCVGYLHTPLSCHGMPSFFFFYYSFSFYFVERLLARITCLFKGHTIHAMNTFCILSSFSSLSSLILREKGKSNRELEKE